jgi:nitrate reductase alpha subunit
VNKKKSPLFNRFKYIQPIERHADHHSEVTYGDRDWENAYRRRWQHDKVVRSTHGVNCTGSCSWNIYVKDGIVTWEGQQIDYPSTGPDMPDFEPRGCPRGASFSFIALFTSNIHMCAEYSPYLRLKNDFPFL